MCVTFFFDLSGNFQEIYAQQIIIILISNPNKNIIYDKI